MRKPTLRTRVRTSPLTLPLPLTLFAAVVFAGVALPAVAGHDHGYGRDVRYGAAGDAYASRPVEFARVTAVDPLVQQVTVQVPVRECMETAYAPAPHGPSYGHGYAHARPGRSPVGATIAGGVIGGVIGDRFGGGEGRDAMRLLGALVGAAIGHDTATRPRHYQPAAAVYAAPAPVTECMTRYEPRVEERISGYRVTYEYHGREYVTHTREAPGDRIPVEVDVRPAY